MIKKEKGITLIALVVTIIVLIILAGVSISLIVGENGIINMAKKAQEDTKIAEQEEKQQLNHLYLESQMVKDLVETVKVGDYIVYSTENLTTPQNVSGGYATVSDTARTPANYTGYWRVLENNGQNVTIISDQSVGNVAINGIGGFNNVATCLNTIANWYKTEFAVSARGVGTGDVSKLSANSMLKTGYSYWTTETGRGSAGTSYFGYYIDANGNRATADFHALNTDKDQQVTSGMRPIIVLADAVKIESGNGDKENPYILFKE